MSGDNWVLLAANCGCCASASPIPVRVEILEIVFHDIGVSGGVYYSDGDAAVTSRVVWSDGTITNGVTSIMYPCVGSFGVVAGAPVYQFAVDGTTYVSTTTTFTGYTQTPFSYSAHVVATPADYEDKYEVGDGTTAIATATFEAQ